MKYMPNNGSPLPLYICFMHAAAQVQGAIWDAAGATGARALLWPFTPKVWTSATRSCAWPTGASEIRTRATRANSPSSRSERWPALWCALSTWLVPDCSYVSASTVLSIVFSLFVAFISIKSSFDVSFAPVDMRAVPPERLLCVRGLHALHALRERAKAEPRSRLNRAGHEPAIGSCCTFAQELPYDRNASSFIMHFYFAQVND